MEIQKINNGESGSIVRVIINKIIDAVNSLTTKTSDLSTKVTNIETAQSTNTFTEEDRTKINSAVTSQTLTDLLKDKVTVVPGSRLISETEALTLGNVATKDDLKHYVAVIEGERMITETEADKLGKAVDSVALDTAIGTRLPLETKEVTLIDKEYKNIVLYARFEGEEGVAEPKQVKVSLPTLISEMKQSVSYPTYKTLEGVQDGINSQFKYRGTLIEESAELYIGTLIYPVNIGFTFEGDTIVITGAPIPKAEDIMRLKAIYLT